MSDLEASTAACTRRGFLQLAAGAAVVLAPRLVQAGTPEESHHARLDLPALAEDPTAVPVRVRVDHPMVRDHFIRSIDLRLAGDPVAHKGTFRFTPSSGGAWVAFPMRSGRGGVLRAAVECSRHGRFVTTRDFRVAGDGCAAIPAPPDRVQLGRPRLRLPRLGKIGDVVEVWARVEHDSDTGLSLRSGVHVRERPPFFVRQVRVYFESELVSDFTFTAALSPNPIIRFPLRLARAGTLRAAFVNSRGRRWEASEWIQPHV